MADAASPAMTSATQRWQEFEPSMCESLNDNPGRWLTLVGDQASVALAIARVDEACKSLAASPAAASSDCLRRLPTALAVTFTTAKHQRMGEDCLAAHGRTPFFAVVDFTNEDDQYSFVLSLRTTTPAAVSEARTSAKRSGGVSGPDKDEIASVDVIEAFLRRVANGSEPRAPQGSRPTIANLCPPMHGTVLTKGRLAVAGNMDTMVRNPHDPDCGTVCVFWSDRCPCCPGAVMMVEALVDLVDRVAAHHHAKAHGSGRDEEGAARIGPVPCRRLHYISCNIDDNDYATVHWPRDEEHQVVPTIAVYRPDRPEDASSMAQVKMPRSEQSPTTNHTTTTTTSSSNNNNNNASPPALRRIRFKGSRTPEELVDFFCRQCLPQDCECTRHISETVSTIARGLSGEELMRCIDEDDPVAQIASETFERANDAYHDLLTSASAADGVFTETEASKVKEQTTSLTREVLGAYTAARRSLVDMEEVTKRALARLEDHSAATTGLHPHHTLPHSDPAKRTDGGDQNCCCAYRPAFLSNKSSRTISAGVMTPPPDANAGDAGDVNRRFLVEVTTHDELESRSSTSSVPRQSPPPQKRGRDYSVSDVGEVLRSANNES